MHLYARQGDLVFVKLDAPPADLAAHSRLVLAGATSAPHTVRGDVMARRDGSTTLLSVTEAVRVEHAGRHLPVDLEPGHYEVRPLRERGGEGDRDVED